MEDQGMSTTLPPPRFAVHSKGYRRASTSTEHLAFLVWVQEVWWVWPDSVHTRSTSPSLPVFKGLGSLIYTTYSAACEDTVINTFCLKADTSQIITCRCSKSFMWVRQMRAIDTDFVAREYRKQQQENTIESLDTLMALMNWSSNITTHICSFYLAL